MWLLVEAFFDGAVWHFISNSWFYRVMFGKRAAERKREGRAAS
jgi:hypothetical protein